MSIGQLGGATFTLGVNAQAFQQGLQRARQQAQQSSRDIGASLQSMASVSDRQVKSMVLGFGQLAGILDDTQYGFRAVANQVQGFSQMIAGAMGASTTAAMGFGAAAGIIGTGINQIILHWDSLMDRMQASWSGRAIEEIRKVREEAERAGEAFDKMLRTPTRAAAKGVEGLKTAITEAPTEELQVQVVKAMQGTEFATPFPDAQARWIKQLRKHLDSRSPEWREKAQKQIDEAELEARRIQIAGDREKARQLLGGAVQPGAEGEAARARLRELNRRNPGIINPNVGMALAAAEPGAVKRQEAFEKKSQVDAEVQRRIRAGEAEQRARLEERLAGGRRLAAARKEAEEKKRREHDDLTRRLMQENEHHMAEEAQAHRQEVGQVGTGLARGRFAIPLLRGGMGLGQQDAFRDRVGRAIDGAGFRIGGAEGFRAMQKALDDRIARTMIEKDVDRATARKMLLAEAEAPERHMKRRVGDILKGAMPERHRAEFLDIGEAWKKAQLDILNGPNDYQKRSAEALEKIVELMQDNPEMAQNIAKWAGMPAIAAGPN